MPEAKVVHTPALQSIVRETLAELTPERIERRASSIAEAHALIESRLGELDEEALRDLLRLLNRDVVRGRVVQGRFATGLVGHNANLLVESLDAVNEFIDQLWHADDAWLAEHIFELRRSRRLVGGGWLFLSMVLHTRDPSRFIPRTKTMSKGLAFLDDGPSSFKTGTGYLEYCRRTNALLSACGISQHGADLLLLNGFRAARAKTGDADVKTVASDECGELEPSAHDDEAGVAPVVGASSGRIAGAGSVQVKGPGSGLAALLAEGAGAAIVTGLVATGPRVTAPVAPRSAPIAVGQARSVSASSPSTMPTADDASPSTKSGPASLGWLHLTDLHQGMGGASWLWPNVKSQLYRDLERMHAVSGPWDLVFFTGDLTQRGSADEFDQLDRLIEHLWDRLGRLGSRPQLIAVPGNHDLVRPADPFDPVVIALRQWHDDRRLRDHVLCGPENAYQERLRGAFGAYSEWAARERWGPAPSRHGALPGDFAHSLSVGGVELGIVGLNSAFLQLSDGNHLERLDVDPRQLHAVCEHDAPEWLRRHHLNFLLTHHSPAWLAPRARREFYSEIDIPGRFAAHLYGHMHEGASRSTAIGGGASRNTLQGASLFGLDEYEAADGRRMERLHGYSAGRVEIDPAKARAKIKVFPRRMLDGKLGRRIERDQENYVLDERGSFTIDAPLNVRR